MSENISGSVETKECLGVHSGGGELFVYLK
jgi:hypothetical protein